MNHKHLLVLMDYFKLGQVREELKRVEGGLLHIMWHVNTTMGSYAIKQLSKKIDLSDKKIIDNYELTERIAFLFSKRDIPAIYAFEKNNKHLFIIDDLGYLLYPWVNAKALDKDAINQPQAIKIGQLLARTHHIDLNLNEIKEAGFDIHSNQAIVNIINIAKEKSAAFYIDLSENLDKLLKINENYHKSIPILENHTVISHGDLDPKNVLWDEAGNPLFIDWESARRLNPTYEIINAALDWSGITNKFNKLIFTVMIKAYREAGGIIDRDAVEAALWGALGNWTNWMVYNINRAITSEDPQEKSIGIEQVNQTLSTILRIKNLMPELINGCDL